MRFHQRRAGWIRGGESGPGEEEGSVHGSRERSASNPQQILQRRRGPRTTTRDLPPKCKQENGQKEQTESEMEPHTRKLPVTMQTL